MTSDAGALLLRQADRKNQGQRSIPTIGVSVRIDAFVTRTGEVEVIIHAMDELGKFQDAIALD